MLIRLQLSDIFKTYFIPMVLQQEMAFIVFAKRYKKLHPFNAMEKRIPVSCSARSCSCAAVAKNEPQERNAKPLHLSFMVMSLHVAQGRPSSNDKRD